MEKVVHKARNHKEAEKWDILQQISMTPEERQKVAKELKKRFYGRAIPGLRRNKDKDDLRFLKEVLKRTKTQ